MIVQKNEEMRNLLVVLGLMVICQFSFAQAQETNQNLLIKARTELEVAVKKEDYERAAELKKEIKLREQIESAVASEDFEEAARLKRLHASRNSFIFAERIILSRLLNIIISFEVTLPILLHS